jgi:acetylornithine deacetylase/succinyl-diaminopimelate desuccinylase-like protein
MQRDLQVDSARLSLRLIKLAEVGAIPGGDAHMLAAICPACVIFVPSANGLSHNVREYTAREDIAAGADVLLLQRLELAE